MAAHGSSIAALQSSLTTGLSNKADQSAFDVLEGVVATKSTPDGVDLKLSNYSTTAAMNGSVAANYGLKTVVDQHSLDIAARITPLEVDTKVANALLGAVTAAALASELPRRTPAPQSAVDTSSEMDSKIAAALLNAVTAAAQDTALLGKADAGVEGARSCWRRARRSWRMRPAAPRRLGGLEGRDAGVPARCDEGLGGEAQQGICYLGVYLQRRVQAVHRGEAGRPRWQSSPCSFPAAELFNAPAWAGFTTWELLCGSNVVRNLHFVAPLSAALANGDDTLSITADCYSTADAAITAALLAYYTSAQVHGQDVLHRAAQRSCEAALRPRRRACPTKRQERWSALLLKHEFLDGGADDVTLATLDVHHQVGGRAQPVPAAEGVASPRRQRVGAHDVPGEGAQGHGVALQLEASVKLAEATELWLLERTRKLPSVVSVGSSSTLPRVAFSAVLPVWVASRIWRP